MYEQKYQELNKKKKTKNIGTIILIVVLALIIGASEYVYTNIELINRIENPTLLVAITIVFYVILFIAIEVKMIEPYRMYKANTLAEIKYDILGRKLSNAFGSDYRIENPLDFCGELEDIDFARQFPISNDYLVLKYNNIRFKYIDCDIFESSDDGIRRFFKGEVFVFKLKESISEDLYIGTKEKFILGDISELENLITNPSIKTINPSNSILKENIELKSTNYFNLIDNIEFQETINKLFESGIKFLIYRNNKIYVFRDNKELLFNIKIDKSSKEQEAEILFEQDIEKLKQHLNEILQYKKSLHIEEL